MELVYVCLNMLDKRFPLWKQRLQKIVRLSMFISTGSLSFAQCLVMNITLARLLTKLDFEAHIN
jgi:hypothetical protein